MKDLPMTGFNKITYEEFLGILQIMKMYSDLTPENKEIIDLLMMGLKKREEENV